MTFQSEGRRKEFKINLNPENKIETRVSIQHMTGTTVLFNFLFFFKTSGINSLLVGNSQTISNLFLLFHITEGAL